jgi:DNA-binding transcriptional LysR family regulator
MSDLSLLTFKQLRAFVTVYRMRKLAAAADRLSVTPSAVSVLLRQVEASLKIRLFDRTTRSLEPTSAAHDAIGSAERILQSVAQLEISCRDLRERRRGQVHLAVTPAIGMALMPQTVRAFAHSYPDIRVVIDDCAPDQFLSRILTDQVDFGIGTPENIDEDIQVCTLVDDKLFVVCTADHVLARKRQVRWTDLASVPLVMVRPGYGVRRIIDQVAGKVGIELNIANEVNFLASVLWMVSSGLGVSILPSALLLQTHFGNLVARPLAKPTVSRAISLVTKRGRSLSPACESFTEMLVRDLRRSTL